MTQNQIRYLEAQEAHRANVAREEENRRSNIAKENETNRSNLEKERQIRAEWDINKWGSSSGGGSGSGKSTAGTVLGLVNGSIRTIKNISDEFKRDVDALKPLESKTKYTEVTDTDLLQQKRDTLVQQLYQQRTPDGAARVQAEIAAVDKQINALKKKNDPAYQLNTEAARKEQFRERKGR